MTIQIEGLTKCYRGVEVLRDINLQVEGGTVVGLQGVNGSGKTMLMRAVCGLIKPTSGRISIDGVEVRAGARYPKRLGMLIEGPTFLPGYTSLENLGMLASIRGVADEGQLRKVIERVGLDPDDRRKYKKYSLGMKQRLGLAAAIMEEPEIVVLDEPTNALDVSGVEMVKGIVASLRQDGVTVLLACHDTRVLEGLSDRIIHIAEGHITHESDGSPMQGMGEDDE